MHQQFLLESCCFLGVAMMAVAVAVVVVVVNAAAVAVVLFGSCSGLGPV